MSKEKESKGTSRGSSSRATPKDMNAEEDDDDNNDGKAVTLPPK